MAGEVEAVVSLSKGIEIGTNLRMSQVVAEVLPDVAAGVLTGPNLAREVAAGHPAACVVALPDEDLAVPGPGPGAHEDVPGLHRHRRRRL